jgi:hypothetical protein
MGIVLGFLGIPLVNEISFHENTLLGSPENFEELSGAGWFRMIFKKSGVRMKRRGCAFR